MGNIKNLGDLDIFYGERKAAKLAGKTIYSTGRPCKYGHNYGRYTDSGKCRKCVFTTTKEYSKNWNRRNRHSKDGKVGYLYKHAKRRAGKLGVPFTITKADIVIPETCPLLGIVLKFDNTAKTKDSSPSIDRIDNTRGYVPGNVWVISWRANSIKRDACLEELELLVAGLKKRNHAGA